LRAERTGLLNAIVRFSLRFRGTIIALATILIIFGLYTLTRAKYDVFPEFTPPLVFILTEASGLSPEQVEQLVTRPIENAVNDVEGIESLRSSSIQGVSVITVKFLSGINIYRARQMVAERLTSLVGQLPKGVQVPIMTPLRSSTSVVLMVGLASNKRSLMDLRTIADWTVKQRLLAVPGVASVAVFGGEVKQLQVQVQPDRLFRYHLSMEDVLDSARNATGIRGAGFIDNQNQRIVLQAQGQSIDPDELTKTVLVHHEAVNVTLGDVARVVEAPQPPIGAGAIDGKPGILLLVTAQYGANTLEVTQGLDRAMGELRSTLKAEGITLYPSLFRPANFIQAAIHNMLSALGMGAILVVIVLFLFLFNFRTAAISCTAIPLSLLAAITVLEHLGFSFNTMILGGLAIAIGEVVDDAVIDVENIFRRLRQNRQMAHPRPVIRVVLEASIEVRSAVVYATFVVVLVFIPILTLSGVAGRLFSPLGIAYILAVLSSLIVALTVTPALCLLLLGRQELTEKEPPLVRWLKDRYRNLLLKVEKRPRTVIGGVIIFVAAGVVALPFLEGEFLPELREGHFVVHVSALPGTSLQESLRLGRQISLQLLKLPYVRSVAQRVGRAEEVEEDIWGTHYSEIHVDLKPGTNGELARSEIRNVLSQFPGINFAINTFLTERIEETISGYTAPVVINIFGNDLDLLDQKAQQIAGILGKIPGAIDIQVQSRAGAPQMMIKLRKNDLMRWGFEPVQVLDVIRTAYQGNVVGQVYEGSRVFDVSVILDPRERKDVSAIARLPIRSTSGAYIPLSQLADIYETSGRFLIMHDGARRVQTVTCDVAGRGVNSLVAYAKKRILSTVSLPAGTYLDFAGTAQAQSRSKRDLLVHSFLAGLGIVLLLSIAIGNYRNVLLILVNLPFALVGGLLAGLISGGVLSLGSMVGFVTVFGITLRNSIMMISHYEHLVSVEGMTWGPAAALQGASERLAPILMTGLVTALGLLPLAIGSGAPGREIEGPMAIVILGGLVTSTVLNLLVIPTLALRYGRFEHDHHREAAS
jgi:CzcA family heavy metal efflux pump